MNALLELIEHGASLRGITIHMGGTTYDLFMNNDECIGYAVPHYSGALHPLSQDFAPMSKGATRGSWKSVEEALVELKAKLA